jgi:N-acetyl-gamma-glutamyl-phosphate reductase
MVHLSFPNANGCQCHAESTHVIKVGIIGGTSYTGEESIKLLLRHPNVEITALTSRTEQGGPIADLFPALRHRIDLSLEQFDLDTFAKKVDVAFCCLPHHISMTLVPELLSAGLKVIDFSADYRIKDLPIYEKYYGEHSDPGNVPKAAFGLPELFRSQIVGKTLVANPGCYPTATSLGLAPLLANGWIETDNIVVNAVSGISGSGRKASLQYNLVEMGENFFAYAPGGSHRHGPEIDQICSDVAGKPVSTLFQPHVGPFARGILSSIYARATRAVTNDELLKLYNEFYGSEFFVRVLDAPPMLKAVAYTNFCDIFPTVSADGKTIVIFSAIDNLIKGAAGQAVQNMNIICDFNESEGLL